MKRAKSESLGPGDWAEAALDALVTRRAGRGGCRAPGQGAGDDERQLLLALRRPERTARGDARTVGGTGHRPRHRGHRRVAGRDDPVAEPAGFGVLLSLGRLDRGRGDSGARSPGERVTSPGGGHPRARDEAAAGAAHPAVHGAGPVADPSTRPWPARLHGVPRPRAAEPTRRQSCSPRAGPSWHTSTKSSRRWSTSETKNRQ